MTWDMSDFLRYSLMGISPTSEEIGQKIDDCRNALRAQVHGAPLCYSGAPVTDAQFVERFEACMECHQVATSARWVVGHTDAELRQAFSKIAAVTDACTAVLGAATGPIPPPVAHFKK